MDFVSDRQVIRRRIVNALIELGKSYRHTVRSNCDIEAVRTDGYEAFKFFLGRAYFQGRTDKLSKRYHDSMITHLARLLQPNFRKAIATLAASGDLPLKRGLRGFQVESSTIWKEFDHTTGKRGDREMVLDALGYVAGLPDHNIVNRTISEIEAGRLRAHRAELRNIRQIGPKISAFYLRDVALVFECKLRADEAAELQPIDTWVHQIRAAVDQICGDETDKILPDDEWFAFFGQDAENSALLNAGAYLLGSETGSSSEDFLVQLADGRLSTESFVEQLESYRSGRNNSTSDLGKLIVRIDLDLIVWLRALAQKRRCTEGAIVEDALREYRQSAALETDE